MPRGQSIIDYSGRKAPPGRGRGDPLAATTDPNADNKLLRIRRLGPALAQHRLRFSAASWGAREVVNELRDFPIGDHDDGPDALEMAFRLLGELRGGSPAGVSRLPLQIR